MKLSNYSKSYFKHLFFFYDFTLWALPFSFTVGRYGAILQILCFGFVWNWYAARFRKETEKRRKQAQTFHELQGNKWELSWEEIKEMFK